MSQAIDVARTLIHLDGAGGAQPIESSRSFWRGGAAAQRYERVLGAFDFRSGEDLHSSMQEMHPEVDEVLLVLSGALDVLVEERGHERKIPLEASQAAIVPRGVWHRLVMRRPGRLLFINNRKGIQTRRSRPTCSPT